MTSKSFQSLAQSPLFFWFAFLATFPVGYFVGVMMAFGQDAAGGGIGMGLGLLFGAAAGFACAFSITRLTLRNHPDNFAMKLSGFLPWIIWAAAWWTLFFTPVGDWLAEKL